MEGMQRMQSGVRPPPAKDQGKQENRREDFYSGEGIESLDSFFDEAVASPSSGERQGELGVLF